MITNLLEIILSTIKTTPSRNFRPTVVVPLFTDSRAYSTWYNRPSGEKVDTPWSYPRPLGCITIGSSPKPVSYQP